MSSQPQQEDYHFILANIKSDHTNYTQNHDEPDFAANILEFDTTSSKINKTERFSYL